MFTILKLFPKTVYVFRLLADHIWKKKLKKIRQKEKLLVKSNFSFCHIFLTFLSVYGTIHVHVLQWCYDGLSATRFTKSRLCSSKSVTQILSPFCQKLNKNSWRGGIYLQAKWKNSPDNSLRRKYKLFYINSDIFCYKTFAFVSFFFFSTFSSHNLFAKQVLFYCRVVTWQFQMASLHFQPFPKQQFLDSS